VRLFPTLLDPIGCRFDETNGSLLPELWQEDWYHQGIGGLLREGANVDEEEEEQ